MLTLLNARTNVALSSARLPTSFQQPPEWIALFRKSGSKNNVSFVFIFRLLKPRIIMTEWSNTVEKRRRKKKADSLAYLKFALTNSYRMRRLKLREERRQKQKDELRRELEEKAALSQKLNKNEFFKRVPIVLCTKDNSLTKERTLEADKEDLPKVETSQKSEIRNVRRKILCNISNINSNPTQLSLTPKTDIVSHIIENNNNNNPAELLLSDGNNSMTK